MSSERGANSQETDGSDTPTFGFTSRQQWIALVATLAAVAYPILRVWQTQNPWPTNYVAVIIVLTAFLFTSRPFFIPTALLVAGAWTFAAWPMLQGEVGFQLGGSIGFSLLCAAAIFELRWRRLARFERETFKRVARSVPISMLTAPPIPAKSEPATSDPLAWCPICKASADAIIRHDGERILGANRSALTLFGVSMPELAALPLMGLFSPERREGLANVLSAANFDTTQSVVSGYRDEAIPVEMFNRALATDPNSPRALLLRDLRAQEDSRRTAASVGRRAQQNNCRIRDLASLASSTAGNLETYLDTLSKSVHRWLPCSIGCFVLLWDNEAEGFAVLASSGALPLQPRDTTLNDALQPLVSHLAEKGEKFVLEQADDDNLGIRQLYPHEPVNACCAIPLMNPAGLVGMLLVLDRNRRQFAPEDLDYLALVGHCAASACNQSILQTQLSFYETAPAAEPVENHE
jgi:PAS domain-containing protein